LSSLRLSALICVRSLFIRGESAFPRTRRTDRSIRTSCTKPTPTLAEPELSYLCLLPVIFDRPYGSVPWILGATRVLFVCGREWGDVYRCDDRREKVVRRRNRLLHSKFVLRSVVCVNTAVFAANRARCAEMWVGYVEESATMTITPAPESQRKEANDLSRGGL